MGASPQAREAHTQADEGRGGKADRGPRETVQCQGWGWGWGRNQPGRKHRGMLWTGLPGPRGGGEDAWDSDGGTDPRGVARTLGAPMAGQTPKGP